jgi:hypothetical protein
MRVANGTCRWQNKNMNWLKSLPTFQAEKLVQTLLQTKLTKNKKNSA